MKQQQQQQRAVAITTTTPVMKLDRPLSTLPAKMIKDDLHAAAQKKGKATYVLPAAGRAVLIYKGRPLTWPNPAEPTQAGIWPDTHAKTLAAFLRNFLKLRCDGSLDVFTDKYISWALVSSPTADDNGNGVYAYACLRLRKTKQHKKGVSLYPVPVKLMTLLFPNVKINCKPVFELVKRARVLVVQGMDLQAGTFAWKPDLAGILAAGFVIPKGGKVAFDRPRIDSRRLTHLLDDTVKAYASSSAPRLARTTTEPRAQISPAVSQGAALIPTTTTRAVVETVKQQTDPMLAETRLISGAPSPVLASFCAASQQHPMPTDQVSTEQSSGPPVWATGWVSGCDESSDEVSRSIPVLVTPITMNGGGATPATTSSSSSSEEEQELTMPTAGIPKPILAVAMQAKGLRARNLTGCVALPPPSLAPISSLKRLRVTTKTIAEEKAHATKRCKAMKQNVAAQKRLQRIKASKDSLVAMQQQQPAKKKQKTTNKIDKALADFRQRMKSLAPTQRPAWWKQDLKAPSSTAIASPLLRYLCTAEAEHTQTFDHLIGVGFDEVAIQELSDLVCVDLPKALHKSGLEAKKLLLGYFKAHLLGDDWRSASFLVMYLETRMNAIEDIPACAACPRASFFKDEDDDDLGLFDDMFGEDEDGDSMLEFPPAPAAPAAPQLSPLTVLAMHMISGGKGKTPNYILGMIERRYIDWLKQDMLKATQIKNDDSGYTFLSCLMQRAKTDHMSRLPSLLALLWLVIKSY